MSGPGVDGSAPGPVTVDAVYVHAPFCQRRCVYCDFAVDVASSPPVEPWLDALSAELGAVAGEGRAVLADRLATLYVGGGTPSLLGPEAMHGIATVLGPERIGTGESFEWTAEANPESLSEQVATTWRRAGLNRLSLGVQSFQPQVLRWMGRLHGADGAVQAVRQSRRAGITNLSVDLIFGLPPHLERDLADDLDRVLALDVPHVSLYGLTAEPATRLGRDVASGRVVMPADDQYAEEYLLVCERLTAAGYEAYEVSNFARPGFRSRHNLGYWTGRPYLGLGNSAHSYLPPERRWNLRDWGAYASATTRAELPVADRERVEGDAARLERLWLGLRTDVGVREADLHGTAARDVIARWRAAGLARPAGVSVHDDETPDARVVLTPEGWLLLDRLVVELDEALEVQPTAGAPGH